LLALRLPVASRWDDPARGLALQFLADPDDPSAPRVLTGHAEGLITVNIAEADDAERERRRLELNEPYRTLLGHFRHEVGHYYWPRLSRFPDAPAGFRPLFGDERRDYGEALAASHRSGPPAGWQDRFVSAYASAHPWEDWAETWAHYLHMTDTLETAVACGLALQPLRPDEPTVPPLAQGGRLGAFAERLPHWVALTYVLNNLNRSLG